MTYSGDFIHFYGIEVSHPVIEPKVVIGTLQITGFSTLTISFDGSVVLIGFIITISLL